jgi:hypothetical protein
VNKSAPIVLYRWRFGYKLSTKERARRGMANDGGHAGCWINEYDCGAPDCIMAKYDGKPEQLTLKK